MRPLLVVGVLTLLPSLALGGAPTAYAQLASATVSLATLTAATAATAQLTVNAVTPSIVTPGSPAVITGTVSPAAGTGTVVVRVVRGRAATTRGEVHAWADGTTSAAGTEVATLSLPSAGDAARPFAITVPADRLRLPRPLGAVPLAVEVLSPSGTLLDRVRTFVGWQSSGPTTTRTLAIAWMVPLLASPDPDLAAADASAQQRAWASAVGPSSRAATLLHATTGLPIAYAVDPALVTGGAGVLAAGTSAGGTPVVAPSSTGTPGTGGGDPESLRATFAQGLSAAATAGQEIFTLPTGDPDLSGLADLVTSGTADQQAAAATLLTQLVAGGGQLAGHGVKVTGALAWPIASSWDEAHAAAVRAAYADPGMALVRSTDLESVGGTASTSPAPTTPGASGAVELLPDRWFGDLLADLTTGGRAPQLQEFIAETAALAAGGASTPSQLLVVAPRTVGAGGDALTSFLHQATALPWVRTVSVSSLKAVAAGEPSTSTRPTASTGDSSTTTGSGASLGPTGASELARIVTAAAAARAYAQVLPTTSPSRATWDQLIATAVGTSWRAAGGRAGLVGRLETATADTGARLTVNPQTTNFLADEGVLQVTVVNELDEPVTGIRLHLQPGNGRLRVLADPEPVTVGAHSRAIVPVRVAAVAQGLVPVTVRLSAPHGEPIGTTAQLSVRANPPGVWLYVVIGGLMAAILLVGIVRTLRRPRTESVPLDLDPVVPAPEQPLERS